MGLLFALFIKYTAAMSYATAGLHLTPESGVEWDDDDTPVDLAARAKAASETIRLLEQEGYECDLSDCEEDNMLAELIAEAYVLDAEDTSKQVTEAAFSDLSTHTVRQVNTILSTFGIMVAKRSEQIRNTVINKLLLLSEDSDKRIQLRALENLGKIGDVGLFTERKDVHITHHSAEETQKALRERLIELKQQADGTYAPDTSSNPSEADIEAAVGLMDD